MARIVIPRPRRSSQRFYRPGPKLDPSMKGKFGAAELQFLTKAIDTAIAVGGKVIGAVERSQMDKGAASDAVAAAARSEGGMGGQKAMDAVRRAQAAADLGAGALAPGPATYAMEQEASSAPTPVATEEAVAVQEVGRPIVAMPGSDAPDREALLSRMDEARADFGAEWAASPPIPPSGPGTYAEALTPRTMARTATPAAQPGAPAPEILANARALSAEGVKAARVVQEAMEMGDIDQALRAAAFAEDRLGRSFDMYPNTKTAHNLAALSRMLGHEYDASQYEQFAQSLPQPPPPAGEPGSWDAPIVGEAIGVAAQPPLAVAQAPGPAPTSPAPSLTTTAPAPIAQAAPAPVAQRVVPQQQVAMSAEEALFRQRRQLDERERQRAAAFSPQSLRRMRPGQLRAVLRFAKTPQEAAAVMGAIRRAPEVQPQGLSDVLSGGHVSRAQAEATKGWRPPRAQAPVSEFEQAIALERHNAWLRESRARAAANQALTDKRNAAIKAAQDKASAKLKKLAARVRGAGSAGKKNAALLDSVDYYVNNYAKRRAGQIPDADWERGAGGFSDVEGPAGLTLRAERLGMRSKIVSRVGQTVDDLRKKDLPTPPKDRRLLSDAQEGIQRRELDKVQNQISKLTADIEIAQARMANQGEFPLNLPQETTGHPPTTPEVLTESLIVWAKERDSKQALLDKISARLAAHEAAVMEDQGAGIPTYVPGTKSAPTKLKSSGSR